MGMFSIIVAVVATRSEYEHCDELGMSIVSCRKSIFIQSNMHCIYVTLAQYWFRPRTAVILYYSSFNYTT